MNFHAITRELPRRRARPEDGLQMAIVELVRFTIMPGVVFHSVPNEGKRTPRLGDRLKRMGLLPGAGDLDFVLPPHGRAAYLELKNGKDGQLTPEQIAFGEAVVAAGGLYAVAYTFEQAAATLREWGAIR